MERLNYYSISLRKSKEQYLAFFILYKNICDHVSAVCYCTLFFFSKKVDLHNLAKRVKVKNLHFLPCTCQIFYTYSVLFYIYYECNSLYFEENIYNVLHIVLDLSNLCVSKI